MDGDGSLVKQVHSRANWSSTLEMQNFRHQWDLKWMCILTCKLKGEDNGKQFHPWSMSKGHWCQNPWVLSSISMIQKQRSICIHSGFYDFSQSYVLHIASSKFCLFIQYCVFMTLIFSICCSSSIQCTITISICYSSYMLCVYALFLVLMYLSDAVTNSVHISWNLHTISGKDKSRYRNFEL